ncbi:ROK family glucokinase [Mycoplasmatota bacterium]|nr:ROK family glucokinase [Mycoplasmatota bacterium]
MKKYLYGVDLGGTTVKIGFFSIEGDLIEKFEIRTNTENSGQMILSDIAKAIETHLEKNNIDKSLVNGVGIGVPGPVSNGVVNRCVNLGWDVVNVKADLEALTNIKVGVSNDANVAGLGELWQGGGSGYSNLIFLTLGTGVGGAVVYDNQVIDGHIGAGGEIGHAPTIDSPFLCNCGKVGCLETVVSATGVVRVANKLLSEKSIDSMLRNNKSLSAKMVFDAAKKNDQLAIETLEIFGRNLGFVCAVLAVTTNPQAFVFGGGVSNAGQIIIDYVKKYFDQYAFYGVKDHTEFKLAKLGNKAGIYGAAFLAKQL